MSKPVLFVTGLGRDVSRAENLMALYEAYDGERTSAISAIRSINLMQKKESMVRL